jgi:phosphate/sulfate permease
LRTPNRPPREAGDRANDSERPHEYRTALGIILAAIAWIVLSVIVGIPHWIAFVLAGGIVALAALTGGVEKAWS